MNAINESESLRDENFGACYDKLSRFCGTDTEKLELDELLFTLYAEHGTPFLNMMEGYSDNCRNYADAKAMMSVISEVFVECGTVMCDAVPLFVKISKNLTPRKLRSALAVYFAKGEAEFEELLKIIDSIGVNDAEFDVFARVVIMTGIERARKLRLLIKHFSSIDDVDSDFISSCGAILMCNGDDNAIADIATKYSHLWQMNLARKKYMFNVRDCLLEMLRAGDVAGARKFAAEPTIQ